MPAGRVIDGEETGGGAADVDAVRCEQPPHTSKKNIPSAAAERSRDAALDVGCEPHLTNDLIHRSIEGGALQINLRKREHIKHASFGCRIGKVAHRADEAERSGWIAWIERAGTHGA